MWEEKNQIKSMPCHLCAKHSRSAGYAKKDGLATKKPNLCHAIYGKNSRSAGYAKKEGLGTKKTFAVLTGNGLYHHIRKVAKNMTMDRSEQNPFEHSRK